MAKSVVGLIFTRYFWMLPVGAIVGAGASLGYYAYAAEHQSEYTAVVPFQVVAPMPPIGSTAEPVKLSLEEIEQIIHRQEFIFRQEAFLLDVLKSSAFWSDGKEISWLMDNKPNPLQALKRDLQVVPDTTAGTFEVRMTARKPLDAFTLAQSASKVYVQKLESDSRTRSAVYARRLEDAVKIAQDSYQIKSDALVDYGRRRGIDVLKSRFDVEKTSLITVNADYVREDLAASSAEQKYEAIKKTTADGKEFALSADVQLGVDSDPTYKALLAAKLNWEQEKAAQSAVGRAPDPKLTEINARISKIDEQIAETHKQLMESARQRMEKMLYDAAVDGRFRADYVNRFRRMREEIVTGIGQDLLVWQQRIDEVREQGDFVSKLRAQVSLAQANQATDDTCVAQMGEPVIPETPSWPQWWNLVPIGAATGLLLSLFPACVAAARYRRKMNEPPAPPAPPSEAAPGSPAPDSPA